MAAMIWRYLLIAAGLLSATASPALVIDSIDVEVGFTGIFATIFGCQTLRQGSQQFCSQILS